MPSIGNHVDAVFIPESVNTSTTLRITGGDLIVNTDDLVVDESTSHVGIGTNNPDKTLVVRGADSEVVIDDTNGTPLLRLRNNGATGSEIGLTSSNDLTFTSGGNTERLRIKSTGEVIFNNGIDTDTIRGKTNNSNLAIGARASNGAFVQAFTITPDRNVGLGETSPSSKFEIVSGDAASVVSGIKLKNDSTSASGPGSSIDFVVDGTNDITTAQIIGQRTSANYHQGSLQFLTRDSAGGGLLERLRITSDGELLLGAISTTDITRLGQTFAIASTDSFGGMSISGFTGTTAYEGPIIDLQRSRATSKSPGTAVVNHDRLGSLVFRGDDGTDFADAAYMLGEVDGTPNGGFVPGRFAFYTGTASSQPTERLRITSSGLVGIGTNSPSSNLDIAATGFVNLKLRTTGNNSSTINLQNSQRNFSVNNVTGGSFTIHDATASAERLRIDSSGNVGIGTNSPQSKLDIHGTNSELRFYRDDRARFGGIRYDGTLLRLRLPQGDHLGIYDSTEANLHLIVKSTGEVGVGTVGPDEKLHVVGGSLKLDAISNLKFGAAGATGVALRDETNILGGSLGGTLGAVTMAYLASAPSSPVQGQFYFNSLSSKAQIYTGSSFVDLVPSGGGGGGGGGSSTDANATFRKYTYSISSTTNSVTGSSDTVVSAGSFVVGHKYTIKTVGTTDFTTIGASANTVGTVFTATGAGSGTGDAYDTLFYSTGGDQNVEVYVNGVKAVEGSTNDYVATSGTSVNFVANLASGDVVDIQVYELLTNDAYVLATGGTFTGNVGINTSTINNRLHIHSNANDQGILLTQAGSNYNGLIADANRTAADNYILNLQANWNGNGVARIAMESGNDTTNKDDGRIKFFTSPSGSNPQVRMHIAPSGNVAIGLPENTEAGARLDVRGTGNSIPSGIHKYSYAGSNSNSGIRVIGIESAIDIVGEDAGQHASSLLLRSENEGFGFYNRPDTDSFHLHSFTTSADDFSIHNGGSNLSAIVDVMSFTKAGLVGIGTTAPASNLQVEGHQLHLINRANTSNTYFRAENTGVGNAGIKMKNSQGEWTIIANDRLRFVDDDSSAERLAIASNGNIKIGSISDYSNNVTNCPVYIAVQTDMTDVGDSEGGASTGLLRIEETGSNNNRYHGIDLRNTNSGDIRFLNKDVGVSDRGDLVLVMPDENASDGTHMKMRFNSIRSSIQISGKGGAVAGNTSTQHTDIYIATKTGLSGIDTGAGAEVAGLIRFEDIGSNNSRYHGIELRNRNSGDVRILNLDEATSNRASLAIAIDNNAIEEALRITSRGNVNIGGDYAQTLYKTQITGDLLLQKNNAAYQHPQIELYNYNTAAYAGAIKFTGNISGTKYTQVTLRVYGGSNTTDGSFAIETGDGSEKLRIKADGNVGINTTNPGAPLSVNTGANAFGIRLQTGSNSVVEILNNDAAGNAEIRGYKNNNTGTRVEAFRFEASGSSFFNGGYVGIGTATPVTPVHIFTGNSDAFGFAHSNTQDNQVIQTYLNPGSNYARFDMDGGAVNNGVGGSPHHYLISYGTGHVNYKEFAIKNNTGPLKIYTGDANNNSSANLVVAADGNIGIGTQTPLNKLHVRRGSAGAIIRIEGQTDRYLYSGTDGSGHYVEVRSTTAATRKLRLQAFDGSSVYTQLFIDAGSSKRVYTSDSTRLTVGDDDSNSRPFSVDSEAMSTEYKAINTNNGYICRNNGGWSNFNDNDTTVGCEVVLYSSSMDGEWQPFSVMVHATSCNTNGGNTASAWYYYRGRVYGSQNTGGFSVVLVDSGGDTGSFTISFNDDGAVGTTFGMGNISEARQFEIRLTGSGARTAGTAFVTSYSGLARFRRQP